MYAILNFAKYLKDHPEVSSNHRAFMAAVRKEANGRGLVGGHVARIVFTEEQAAKFEREVLGDPTHQQVFKGLASLKVFGS